MISELPEKILSVSKNPHFDKLMTKVEVDITKEDWVIFCEYAKLTAFHRN